MSILVAEVGGTKSEWWTIHPPDNKHHCIRVEGFHPLWDSSALEKSILPNLVAKLESKQFKAIYYYGTGCSNPAAQAAIEKSLLKFFKADIISISDDLTGAAMALSNGMPGIVSILGTGSSSGFFNGRKFTDKIPSLGLLAGDDGSGAHLGKNLVRSWMYRTLPEDLQGKLESWLGMYQIEFIKKLYSVAMPGQLLADLALFASQHRSDPFVYHLLKENFENFAENILQKYLPPEPVKYHFCGSFVWHFQDILISVIESRGWTVGKIIEKPGQILLQHHNKILKTTS